MGRSVGRRNVAVEDPFDAGAGDDVITVLGDDLLYAGDGDDVVYFPGDRDYRSNPEKSFADLGAGNDHFWFDAYRQALVTIVGGLGVDTYHLENPTIISVPSEPNNYAPRIEDFTAGMGGDQIDLFPFLDSMASRMVVPRTSGDKGWALKKC